MTNCGKTQLMVDVVKTPHTAMIVGNTGSGKTELALKLIQNEYYKHFENIVIICPTLKWNKTYHTKPWIWEDDNVYLVDPEDELYNYINFFSKIFAGEETLFLIDDIISDESLDKTRSPFIKLAVSGRHKNHYCWVLTQRYTKIPVTVRDQLKQIFIFYQKNRDEFDLVHKENYIIESKDDLALAKDQLKKKKHAYLFLRMEDPKSHKIK